MIGNRTTCSNKTFWKRFFIELYFDLSVCDLQERDVEIKYWCMQEDVRKMLLL